MKRTAQNFHHLAILAASLGALSSSLPARADEPPAADLATLLKRIKELEEKVNTLQQNHDTERKEAIETAKTTPLVTLGGDGLVVKSADSNFVAFAHGYVQADGRFYPNQKETTKDTFLLRRVRPILEGTVYQNFDYRLMLDFASGNGSSSTAGNNALLDDAYVNARFWKEAQFQIGKYKSPIGLERLKSTADLTFVETGYATALTPNYDLGAEVHNDYFKSPVGYALGIFNGATDGGSSDQDVNDEGKDIVGRLFFQPFLTGDNAVVKHFGLGVAGSFGNHQGALPSYKTSGQQTFYSYATGLNAAGEQYRVDPQFFWHWGPLGVEGEFVISSQKVQSTIAHTPAADRLQNTAGQLEVSYFLTGEDSSFKSSSLVRVAPNHPFAVNGGGWGAFEIAGRLMQMSLDSKAFADKYTTAGSARAATAWDVGVNWYLNRNIKFNLDYESTAFRTGGGTTTGNGPVTSRDEHVILTQVQVAF